MQIEAGGEPFDRSEVARDLIRRLDHWYELGRAEGPESLNAAWRDRCEHLGRIVEVTTSQQGTEHGRLDEVHLQNGLTLDVERPTEGGPARAR